jgi:hypothetical protein
MSTIRHIALIDNSAIPLGFATLATDDNKVLLTVPMADFSLAVVGRMPNVRKVMMHPDDRRRFSAAMIMAISGDVSGSA